MIPALVKTLGNTFNKTAGTTLALTTTGATAGGNLIVAWVLFDNAATASKPTVSSITKQAGETANWVFLGAARSTSTSAGAFSSGELWAIQTTVNWSAAAYTVTLDSSVTQKAMAFTEFSGVQAVTRSTTGTNYSTTTTAASASTTGTTPQTNDLALGFIFGSNVATAMAGDNDTTAGSWSTPVGFGSTGGSAATNNFGIGQHKVLTSGSHQTLNNQAAMTAGNGAIVAVLQSIPEPSITQAAYRFYADDGLNSTLSDSYPSSNYDGSKYGVYGTTTDRGQSFLGDGKSLVRAGLYLAKLGSPTGTVVSKLYAHTGTFGTGTGTGSALATSVTSVDAATLSTSPALVYFDFAGYVLSSGTPYVITVSMGTGTFDASNRVDVGARVSGSSHAGSFSTNSGSWSSSGGDLIFEVYTATSFGETNSTPLAAQDTAYTADVSNGDVNLQIRTRMQETAGNAVQPGDDFQLQYERNGSTLWNQVAVGAEELAAYYYSNATYFAMWPGASTRVSSGESFTGNGSTLTRMAFYCSKVGTVAGTVIAELYNESTKELLATSTTSYDIAGFSSTLEEKIFSFNGVALTPGVTYIALVAHVGSGGSVSNCMRIMSDNTGSYAGTRWNYDGTTWTNATNDLTFTVYSNICTTPFQSSNLTDAAATTNRLTGGSGTFVAGEVSEDGLVDDLGWTGNNYTELLYSVSLKQSYLANSDTLRFRVLRNGATTGITYSQTPTINITKTDPAVTQAAYRFYADGTESGSTALAEQDTAYVADVSAGNVNLQVRTRLQSTSTANIPTTTDYILQYEKNASGTWKNIAIAYPDTVGYGTAALSTAGQVGWGQSFVGNGQNLTLAYFLAYKGGTPNATNVTAALYSHTGTFGTTGKPDTLLQSSTTNIGIGTITTSPAWYAFAFDGTYTLVDGTNYCIVFLIDNGGPDASNHVSTGYNSSGAPGNRSYLTSGVWTDYTNDLLFVVKTDGPVTSHWSSNITGGAATTNRLTGGSGTFSAGEISETGIVDNIGFTGNNFTELLYSMTLLKAGITAGDTLRFRILKDASTTGMTYTQIPTITTGPPPIAVNVADTVGIGPDTFEIQILKIINYQDIASSLRDTGSANLMDIQSSFETDGNLDGISDGWRVPTGDELTNVQIPDGYSKVAVIPSGHGSFSQSVTRSGGSLPGVLVGPRMTMVYPTLGAGSFSTYTYGVRIRNPGASSVTAYFGVLRYNSSDVYFSSTGTRTQSISAGATVDAYYQTTASLTSTHYARFVVGINSASTGTLEFDSSTFVEQFLYAKPTYDYYDPANRIELIVPSINPNADNVGLTDSIIRTIDKTDIASTLRDGGGNNILGIESSFETDSNVDGLADGWTNVAGPLSSPIDSYTRTAVVSGGPGSYSQSLTINAIGTTQAILGPMVPVVPGQSYRTARRIYNPGASTVTAMMYLYYYDAAQVYVSAQSALSTRSAGTNTVTNATYTVPAGCWYVRPTLGFHSGSSNPGTLVFDELSVYDSIGTIPTYDYYDPANRIQLFTPILLGIGDTSNITDTFSLSVVSGASGRPKIWTGSAWAQKPGKVYMGAGPGWVEKPFKIWTGTEWKKVP